MNVARWTGMFAAALALGCAGQQAETRTSAADPRAEASTQSGGAPDATASNEQAPSQRPSSGAGSQAPHPDVASDDVPTAAGGTTAGSGTATGATAGMSGVEELPEVYGQVKEIDDDEIEIEPAYGDSVKLKLNEQSMIGGRQASAGALSEGDEVRAAYEERGDEKVAVDLVQDPPEATILDNLGTSSGESSSGDTAAGSARQR